MISIVDYGMGNVASILNMIKRVDGEAIITSSSNVIANSSAIILPGVGTFDSGINKLKEYGLLEIINKSVIENNKILLGICLGMQLLFNSSEEGEELGLGFINGKVKKFNFSNLHDREIKIPHMGWNKLESNKNNCLFKDMGNDLRFYFVHSFYCECENEENVIAQTNYGINFCSTVQKNNIFGVQFHPEKSHKFGMKFFENFLKVCDE